MTGAFPNRKQFIKLFRQDACLTASNLEWRLFWSSLR